jgi:hypothetical protein
MKNQFKKMRIPVLLLSLLLFAGFYSYSQIEIEIQVAPSTLNLSNSGQWVTVHTDIAFSLVEGATVKLDDKIIYKWFADNQNNFVAKFQIDVIKSLFE